MNQSPFWEKLCLFVSLTFLLLWILGCNKVTKKPQSNQASLTAVSDPSCDALAPPDPGSRTNLALVGGQVQSQDPQIQDFVQKAQNAINDLIHVNAMPVPGSYKKSAGWEHVNFSFSLPVKDSKGNTADISLCQFSGRVQMTGARTFVNGTLPVNIPLKNLPSLDAWVSEGQKQRLRNLMAAIPNLKDWGVANRQENLGTPTQTSIDLGNLNTFTEDTTQTQVTIGPIKERANILFETGEKLLVNVTETPCLVYDKKGAPDRMLPGFELKFYVGRHPYYGLVVGDKIYEARANFFSQATMGKTVSFQKTPLSSSNLVMTAEAIPGMSAGGTLCSARFKIVLDNVSTDSTVSIATASNESFAFPPEDFRFNEASVFTNATLHSNWFMQAGRNVLKSWPHPRLDIYLDMTNNAANNSAVYIPPDPSVGAPPHIELGNGDGVILKNLQIDSDAIQHETGHHVVYQTLKTTSGDSLVLHEGLADFFVMVHKNSPCLGNLICPKGGTICVSTACLRSAKNTWSYTDPNLPTEPHKESQFISGLLWDIKTQIGGAQAAQLTLKAIDFFPSDAGFSDLIQALMEADKTLYKGIHACLIQNLAGKRGLQGIMSTSGIDCKNYE